MSDKQSYSSNGEKKATDPHIPRIALVFDFDETLAPDSFSALLVHCGLEPEKFKEEKIRPLLENGWDKKLARFHALIEESNRNDNFTLTADTFAEVGKNLELYPEVEQMFGRVTNYAQEIIPDIDVEFYMLTAGMLEIPEATAIANEFRTLWGGHLHFDDDGNLAFIKQIVTYPDKIRYLLKLCKGFDIDHPQILDDVYREIPEEAYHVPLKQIIYVGDGASDMPVFAYLNDHKGLSLGVFEGEKSEEWEGYEDIHGKQRVQNLAPADYSEGSELMESLKLAVQSICKQIALRQMSIGE
mgnify:CR=1 FL=1